jgi:outer membrane cobalamin receptor
VPGVEHLDQKSNFAGSVTRVDPSRNAQSFYSQLLLQWRGQLFVTSGFRLDDGSTYGTHVNPRVSTAYVVPLLQTKLHGGYGEGLKAPSTERESTRRHERVKLRPSLRDL